LFQKSLAEQNTESFCSKKVWWSKTRRVFVPKKSGGAKHGEFFFQKSLAKQNTESFSSKNLGKARMDKFLIKK